MYISRGLLPSTFNIRVYCMLFEPQAILWRQHAYANTIMPGCLAINAGLPFISPLKHVNANSFSRDIAVIGFTMATGFVNILIS